MVCFAVADTMIIRKRIVKCVYPLQKVWQSIASVFLKDIPKNLNLWKSALICG
jgi:hypothetical protein